MSFVMDFKWEEAGVFRRETVIIVWRGASAWTEINKSMRASTGPSVLRNWQNNDHTIMPLQELEIFEFTFVLWLLQAGLTLEIDMSDL